MMPCDRSSSPVRAYSSSTRNLARQMVRYTDDFRLLVQDLVIRRDLKRLLRESDQSSAAKNGQ